MALIAATAGPAWPLLLLLVVELVIQLLPAVTAGGNLDLSAAISSTLTGNAAISCLPSHSLLTFRTAATAAASAALARPMCC